MGERETADQILGHLAAARARIEHATRAAEDVRRYAGSAERALEDVEVEHSRLSMAPEGALGASYLAATFREVDILRTRSAVSSSAALELQEDLVAAGRAVEAARRALDGVGRGTGVVATEGAELRTQIDHLAGVLHLAAPLADAAADHLRAATQIATHIVPPALDVVERSAVAVGVGRGLNAAGREIARGEETARHLDRAMGYVTATAGRALARADDLSGAAHERRRPTTSAPDPGVPR